MVSFLQVSLPKFCIHLSSLPYTPHAPPISFFSIYHRNKIGWELQIIKLLSTQFSPLPCHLVRLRAILRHSLPTFLPHCKRPTFTPIQKTGNKAKNAKLDKGNSIVILPAQHYDIKYKISYLKSLPNHQYRSIKDFSKSNPTDNTQQ